MREPLRWCLEPGYRAPVDVVAARLRAACRGPSADDWQPPGWLFPHQVDAARRIAGSLAAFGGAILADAVGLGKTFVALSIATRYRDAAVVAPASLVSQWRRAAEEVGVTVTVTADSALSRGDAAPRGALLVVDEAHRYRNPDTRRHRAISCRSGAGDLLLLTATPVVSRSREFVNLLSLFLPDNALATLGIPSLERAGSERHYQQIARAAWVITVARSPESLRLRDAIPGVRDSPVASPAPVSDATLEATLTRLRDLAFPAFRDQTAAALLSMHLRYRLASSAAAFMETVDRHLAYLRRAITAAASGERLSRRDARALFGEEDPGQLSLDLRLGGDDERIDSGELEKEVDRLVGIRDLIRRDPSDPKMDLLQRILLQRGDEKTIVFTSAVATARALARGLGWRRVAVVTGKGAWIASGMIPLDEALRLFAPLAQGAPVPEPVTSVATLIATDLASEGLNLQDASAVIHYDLPWTPLRLAQRVGRAARLGSAHRSVGVWWFAPPSSLDEGLGLARRIEEKLINQVQMSVPVSSQVGRASVIGTTFLNRERFVGQAVEASAPVYCVVEGPRAALFAIRWLINEVAVPELIVLENGQVVDEARSARLTETLLDAAASAEPLNRADLAALRHLIKARLAASELGPVDQRSRKIRRIVLRLGMTAARHRDERRLDALDRVMSAITLGLIPGRLQNLEYALRSRGTLTSINNWLGSATTKSPRPISVILDTMLVGSGAIPLS